MEEKRWDIVEGKIVLVMVCWVLMEMWRKEPIGSN